MKKLMIAAAIVCAAAFTQAASIDWASNAEQCLLDASGNIATTDMGYEYVLVCLGTTADYDNAVIRGSTGSFEYDEVNMISGSYTLVSGTDVDGMIYTIMAKDADGNLAQLQYADGALAGKPIETYTLSGFVDASSTPAFFNVGNSGNFQVAAVPEPTSGLLLLLGVAGLALKRKRA